jgi:DNA-binding IclR family transcriptional regulator
LAILAAFDEKHRSLTLTEVARRAALPVPTANRLIGGLVAGGALQRSADGRYTTGPLTWRAGLLAPVSGGSQRVAEPFLHDVYAATMATVHLAVRDGEQVLYLERMAGRMSVPILSEAGSRLPMHATWVGKVLLAHAPADVQAHVCAKLTRVTPHTITQPSVLRAQLALIRREGMATTSEEMSRGAAACMVGRADVMSSSRF